MRKSRAAIGLLAGLAVVASGCSNPTSAGYQANLLDGNWRIAGVRSDSGQPFLSIAMGVTGGTVIGSGDVRVPCGGGGSIGASPVQFKGQLAPDGTFQMKNSPKDLIQVTIQGQAPAKGSSTWTGQYTMVNAAAEKSCMFDLTAGFTTIPYALMNGTYAGTLTGTLAGATDTLHLTTMVKQGVFTEVRPNSAFYAIPLAASVVVSGSSCLQAGHTTDGTTSPATGSINGDVFELNFAMNDGSILSLFGHFTDATEDHLQVETGSDSNGKCAWTGGAGVLNRE